MEKNQKAMWLILGVSVTGLFAGLLAAVHWIPEGPWLLAAIIGICIVFLIPCFYALRLEVSTGAYRCKTCGHEIVPTYREALCAPHCGTTRYLKCPVCGKRTWCKKIWTK
ncbi:MAG: hypothetical protein IKC04_07655 [Oscillospiraceae bacterium]|nr:hypothetical protein [Oscillospiraceae bacterium]